MTSNIVLDVNSSYFAARRLLKSLSIKQGLKYDSPESIRDIPTFIEFHKLKVNEILKPLDEFSKYIPSHVRTGL